MIYRKFQDIELSNLAMGAMRLPVVDGNDAAIDEAAAFEMVDCAMAQGVNYYDTAWGYHGGNSELVMGRALARHPREKFYLADKFPGYDLANMDKVEEIFETQLKKCGVEYFDFYLFHNVCELNVDGYLDERFGIHKYLMEQKRNGRIRHLGFSSHGSLEVMERFLGAYGKDMEFCQLQLNYVDWTFQKAKEKAELILRRGLPIWVMEPLRGGLLANLPEKAAALLGGMPPVEWAYRFLQSVPGVTVVLSGASSMEQMKENLRIFAEDRPLADEEQARLMRAADEIMKAGAETAPCTACHYCVSHCPQGLDIPWLLELYNEHVFTGGGFIAPMALSSLADDKKPSACVGCRSCEQVCPQQIKISEVMSKFDALLNEKK